MAVCTPAGVGWGRREKPCAPTSQLWEVATAVLENLWPTRFGLGLGLASPAMLQGKWSLPGSASKMALWLRQHSTVDGAARVGSSEPKTAGGEDEGRGERGHRRLLISRYGGDRGRRRC